MNQETIERAARAAYVEMEWPDRITEHDSNRKADGEYKERAAKRWDEGNAGWSHYRRYRRQAAAVIAAIHPTVSTVEELDALPNDTIVMDELGIGLRKTIVGWWADTGDNRMSSEYLAGNSTELTVLNIGGAA